MVLALAAAARCHQRLSLSFFPSPSLSLLQFHARFGERPAMSGSAAGHTLLQVTGLSVHSKLAEYTIATATSSTIFGGFFFFVCVSFGWLLLTGVEPKLTLSLCCNRGTQRRWQCPLKEGGNRKAWARDTVRLERF